MGGYVPAGMGKLIAEAIASVVRFQISGGYFAVVDVEDAPLATLSWWGRTSRPGGTVYARRYCGTGRKDARTTELHREVMERVGINLDGLNVDHINGDGLDNRRCNLRAVTPTENKRNTPKRRDNTSGFPGVHWRADANRWRVQIGVGGRFASLGYFKSFEEACQARRDAERELWGIQPRRADMHR